MKQFGFSINEVFQGRLSHNEYAAKRCFALPIQFQLLIAVGIVLFGLVQKEFEDSVGNE